MAKAKQATTEKKTQASAHEKPQVAIIMGSDSDLPVMQAAADILEQFNIPFELTIVSAHRTPKRMFEYASSAKARELKVIIAGAGGEWHSRCYRCIECGKECGHPCRNNYRCI